jgi:hypothetical protein
MGDCAVIVLVVLTQHVVYDAFFLRAFSMGLWGKFRFCFGGIQLHLASVPLDDKIFVEK